MSRTTKIILIVGGLLAVLCLCAAVTGYIVFQKFAQNIQGGTDPAKAAEVAHKIADYDLPAGYTEKYGISLMGMDTAAIGPENYSDSSALVIMLMQFPQNLNYNEEQMEEQMRRSMEQQYGRQGYTIKTVETKTITVRGQDAVETISEGTDEDGNTIRQITVLFQGKSGTAMLMLMGQMDDWDNSMVEKFIQSLR